MLEEARRASADADIDSARDKRTDPEAELTRIEGEVSIKPSRTNEPRVAQFPIPI